jgi:hypothetical protein
VTAARFAEDEIEQPGDGTLLTSFLMTVGALAVA